ncbi:MULTISPECIES: hypothetical protein [unclassified Brevibacillus]|uniref:hypothetical protein n=1 Tax=Brevibacillus TaxID=55080 RepID=UPI000ECB5A2A|nr:MULTISPECIES: hypothetical protein [unclassified Brevibacillus]UED69225.1 hypothetical protein HP435_00510 [Brevibacillus sp. HD3.3A]HBZ82580.1 hypothetical protein [Brevibacillus sp.]
MAKLKQYADTIQVSTAQLEDILEVSENIYDHGLVEMDGNMLASSISIAASIATMVFSFAKKKNFAIGLVALVLSFDVNLRDQLKNHVRKANQELGRTVRYLLKHPEYIQVELEAVFMDFDEGRIITGPPEIKRVKTRQGWQTL